MLLLLSADAWDNDLFYPVLGGNGLRSHHIHQQFRRSLKQTVQPGLAARSGNCFFLGGHDNYHHARAFVRDCLLPEQKSENSHFQSLVPHCRVQYFDGDTGILPNLACGEVGQYGRVDILVRCFYRA